MIGYILTTENYNQVQGQFINPYQFINCVQDINDVWFLFLSNEDKIKIKNTEWSFILDLPQGEYIPKPSPLFQI
jgi:hypothetical protein